MKEIAKNKFYEISVDGEKNRLYLKIIGFWRNPEAVPHYTGDLLKATKELKRGFTILSDLREMLTPPVEITAIHEGAQKFLINAGLSRTAEVLSNVILKMVTKKYSDVSHMKKMEFTTIEEAEKWLDNPNIK